MLKQLTAFAVCAFTGFWAMPAMASPGFDFVCFNRDVTASIGFDLSWEHAYVSLGSEEIELPATGEANANDGGFDFADVGYVFRGFAPEGQLSLPDGRTVRCHQSRDSIKTLALYGVPENQGRWSSYDARGTGSGNVRQSPSVFAEKVASLGDGEPVIIKQNTDEFLDGFFWFQIEFGEGEMGYIWGALLCTDEDDPELNATVRRCN